MGNRITYPDLTFCFEVIDSSQRIKLAASSGQRLPAFCTASGKAILAYMPERDVQQILDRGMPQHTRNTILTPEAYFENMRNTRKLGFENIWGWQLASAISAIHAILFNPLL